MVPHNTVWFHEAIYRTDEKTETFAPQKIPLSFLHMVSHLFSIFEAVAPMATFDLVVE